MPKKKSKFTTSLPSSPITPTSHNQINPSSNSSSSFFADLASLDVLPADHPSANLMNNSITKLYSSNKMKMNTNPPSSPFLTSTSSVSSSVQSTSTTPFSFANALRSQAVVGLPQEKIPSSSSFHSTTPVSSSSSSSTSSYSSSSSSNLSSSFPSSSSSSSSSSCTPTSHPSFSSATTNNPTTSSNAPNMNTHSSTPPPTITITTTTSSSGRPNSKKPRVGSGSSSSHSSSSSSSSFADASIPLITYKDLAGMESVMQDIKELVEYPLTHPEIYTHLGVDPPRGVLLHGPPGSGKTVLAQAIAGEAGVKLLRIAAPEVVSGMSGESESKIRVLFDRARDSAPCLVFIDEIDAITPNRDSAQREMERRIVAQLLTCMDSLSSLDLKEKPVLVIGATNRPDSLDPALRRAGRFDREIAIPVPDEGARLRILQLMCSKLRLSGNFDFASLAKRTPGYVGADLQALTKEAAVVAINRIFLELEGILGLGPNSYNSSTPNPGNGDSDNVNVNVNGNVGHGKLGNEVGESNSRNGMSSSLYTPEQTSMMVDGDGGDPLSSTNVTEIIGTGPRTATATATATATGIGTGIGKSAETSIPSSLSSEILHHFLPSTGPASSFLPASLLGRIASGAALKRKGRLSEDELNHLSITMDDFQVALAKVQPSAQREGFAVAPDVSFDDIGALDDVREELFLSVVHPVSFPDQYRAFGLDHPSGILLYGPPGCGKTMLAKAVANECHASFISIKGPELLNKFVGESERAVRKLFMRARSAAPCIIFFDELDALCPRRGSESINQSTERVVNQLLTEMDGLDTRKQIFVIGATNRPDIIDPAMLRPGRLDKLVYVPLPSAEGRASILRAAARKTPLSEDVDLDALAHDSRSAGFSGADLAFLVREAALSALKDVLMQSRTPKVKELDQIRREKEHGVGVGGGIGVGRDGIEETSVSLSISSPPPRCVVARKHFDSAFSKVMPSVSVKDEKLYERLRQHLRTPRMPEGGLESGGGIGRGDKAGEK